MLPDLAGMLRWLLCCIVVRCVLHDSMASSRLVIRHYIAGVGHAMICEGCKSSQTALVFQPVSLLLQSMCHHVQQRVPAEQKTILK